MKKITKRNVFEEWAVNYHEVTRWLQALQRKKANALDLYRFCRWSGKTPPELLALKSNPASKEAEKLLDDFVADEKAQFTNSVMCRISTAVKSFFKHNYCDLARASGAITLEKVKPYNLPSKENLRKLWNWALNPRDKALITFTNSTAVAKDTLAKLQWKHLEENWEKQELPCIDIPDKLLKGRGRGRYKGVKQITFLTPEAKRDLLNYREWIQQQIERKLTSEDNIFWKIRPPYKPVTYEELGILIWRLTRKAGVPFSLHDARRYVNTAMEQIGMPSNWARKIRGRKVRGEEAPYSLPAIEQLRAKFKEAVNLLEFTTERKVEIPPEVQERLDALAEEQRELKRRYGIFTRKADRVLEVQIEEEKKRQSEESCADGKNCGENELVFRQIEENELLTFLQNGWQIVKELKSGDCIVQRGGE